MSNERLPPPKTILGRLETTPQGITRVTPLGGHRAQVFLHQKKVQQLVDAAQRYAQSQTDETLTDLLHAALTLPRNR